MKILGFPIVKFTACLVIGIVFSQNLQPSFFITILLFSALTICVSISFLGYRFSKLKPVWFGVWTVLWFMSLGILTNHLHQDRNKNNHYSNSKSFKQNSEDQLTLRILEILKSNNFSNRYIAEVERINDKKTFGKILLHIRKDSTRRQEFNTDDFILIEANLLPLNSPLNPGQFDYKGYLESKQIFSQIQTNPEKIFKIDNRKHTVSGYANKLRNHIQQKLKVYDFTADELAVINALFLGQRKDISSALYNEYTNAGAIHILAISGLHIGIILIILQWIFQPFGVSRRARIWKSLIILVLLWGFATMTGLSPSVVRATTMFTALTIGMNLGKPNNSMNNVAISAFVLLLIKPSFLFDVGFQLSYMAVIGILIVEPDITKLYRSKYWVKNKIWQTFTVSIAAQFGILPLSIYYFHQFPGLFLISNMVVIPLLGIILGYGIFVILLALLNAPNFFIIDWFGKLIYGMNSFFSWVAKQDQFIFKDISINLFTTIALYLFLILLFKLYQKFSYRRLGYFIVGILILQICLLVSKYQTENHNEFVIFNKSRSTAIGTKHGKHLLLHHNLSSSNNTNLFLRDYKIDRHISEVEVDTIRNLYVLGKEKLLVIDSSGVYQFKNFKPDYVLLRNSPRINLERLIDSLHPKMIIADASNYKSYVLRWEQTCVKAKLPFHQTSKKGAFIKKLN